MGWLNALLGRRDETALALYTAVVREGREPHWYAQGLVPDTIDGRFDCIATVLAVALLRLEQDPEGAEPAARVTERFVEDMEGQIREAGIGDVVVGKKVGGLMGALGGRLGAYRAPDRSEALLRNLYRGEAPAPAQLAVAEAMTGALEGGLAIVTREALKEGRLG